MTIESKSQLLSPQNRIAAKSERDFKKALQKDLPTTFDVMIFADFETESLGAGEEEVEIDLFNPNNAKNFKFVRARSLVGHHDHLLDPSKISDEKTRQAFINDHFQAKIPIDHPNISQLRNGSVWSCTYVGGELVQLNNVVQESAFYFTNDGKKIIDPLGNGSSKDAFKSRKKTPLGVNPRTSNDGVEVKFKNDRSSLIEQSKKTPYDAFLPIFSKYLSESSFSQELVVVTSMFRGPVDQVEAMMGGRIYQGNSASYRSFRQWAIKNYGYREGYGGEIQAIIGEKDWSTDVAGLKSKLIAKVKEQFNAGRFISNHMESGALDIRTNDISWDDVQAILSTLSKLKAAGHVKKYQIENARPTPTSTPPGPEHIHFSLTTKGAGE